MKMFSFVKRNVFRALKKKQQYKKKSCVRKVLSGKALIQFTLSIIIINRNKIEIAPIYTTRYTNPINSTPKTKSKSELKKIQPTRLSTEYIGFSQKISTKLKNTAKLLNNIKKLKYIETL
jgi:hypothetical protein